ncbi:MAG TPA: efflux RND transporter periplasmic adaptor subunit, partial [Burkholderiaceae bacterium]|nr:efflux RND transporter periplasmic adaptor subunit [Burkholderiaceae bacterium]
MKRGAASLAAAAALAVAAAVAAQAPPNGEPTVTVAAFGDVQVRLQREAPASVVARNESRLAAEVTARIVAIDALVGQTVQRGQVLARLDDVDFRLALSRLQAQRDALQARLQLAERQLQRSVELQRQNFISPEALNQRETEVTSLRADLRVLDAQLATARRQIDKTLIRAPFDGVVRERAAQLGELATPGAPLFVLVESDATEVSAQLQVADAERFADADDVHFDTGLRRYPLQLLRISPLTRPESRTREARLAFAGDGPHAPPGTAGRLVWHDPRPAVPPALVVRRNGQLGVFVVDDGRARFVPLP